MTNININIDFSVFQNELRRELHSHIVSLQILLENLNENSITNREVKLGILGIQMPLIPNHNLVMSKNEINKAFISTIRSFQNFIDKLIALIEFFKKEYKTEYDIKSSLDFDIFLQKKLNEIINEISTDKSLNFPKKLQKLNIDEDTKKILLGYSTLRNNLEHHKDVSSKDTELNFFVTSIYVNDIELTELNQIIEKGSVIDVRKKTKTRLISKGENVEIFESEIFEIIFTLSELISSELINSTFKILETNNSEKQI